MPRSMLTHLATLTLILPTHAMALGRLAERAGLPALRARFPAELGARARASAGPLSAELPSSAEGPVVVRDAASGVGARVRLERARPAAREAHGDLALYPGAAPGGGALLRRADAEGAEDFVAFEHAPSEERLRWRLELQGAAGLRLVDGVLELLDASGTPRLRAPAPYVRDARGVRVRAALEVEGCAVDRSPAAPWGRPVTPPGASACSLVVRWEGQGVRYPALVDPAWVSAGRMVAARAYAAAALLPSQVAGADVRPLLLTGGVDEGGALLSSAELYEPLSRTFSPTGPMQTARAAHTATAVPGGPYLLVAGGAGAVGDATPPGTFTITRMADSASTELYDATAGTFSGGPSMSAPRFNHAAVALADGRILLAGGTSTLTDQPTSSADLYTFDAQALPGSIAPTSGPMHVARSGLTASPLPTGAALLSGGLGSAGFALTSVELFCPPGTCPVFGASDSFVTSSAMMSAPRAFHTATVLASGDVLLAGGVSGTTAPVSVAASADRYSLGAFGAPLALNQGRAVHAAVALDPPWLLPTASGAQPVDALFLGGWDGTQALGSVEGHVAGTDSVVALSGLALTQARAGLVAAAVPAGLSVTAGRAVLAAGGYSGAALRSAELLVKVLGDACAADAECGSGHCVSGLCCDTTCANTCTACAQAAKQDGSADGTCGPALAGTALPAQCAQGVELHPECDGAGGVRAGPGTHACFPGVCAGAACASGCDAGSDCATGAVCAPAADGGPGACQPVLGLGAPCGADADCGSGHCADGVCCSEACAEQCRACDVPGSAGACVTVTGAPHGARAACPGSGPCAAACDGLRPDACTFPGAAVVCGTGQCGAGQAAAAPTCDGDGGCAPGAVTGCGGYACSGLACGASCAGDVDCLSGFVCSGGACLAAPDAGPAGASSGSGASSTGSTGATGSSSSTGSTGSTSSSASSSAGSTGSTGSSASASSTSGGSASTSSSGSSGSSGSRTTAGSASSSNSASSSSGSTGSSAASGSKARGCGCGAPGAPDLAIWALALLAARRRARQIA